MSNNPKFTPGPWGVVAYYDEDKKAHDWDVSAEDGGGDMVADLKGLDNAKNNAALIAAAPELLEACKELLLYINADNELKSIMYPQSINMAEQAIAKAEGH